MLQVNAGGAQECQQEDETRLQDTLHYELLWPRLLIGKRSKLICVLSSIAHCRIIDIRSIRVEGLETREFTDSIRVTLDRITPDTQPVWAAAQLLPELCPGQAISY